MQLYTQYTPYKLKPINFDSSSSAYLQSYLPDHPVSRPTTDIRISPEVAPSTKGGWCEEEVKEYVDCVFEWMERYAPGFRESVLGIDVLTPDRLEKVFELTGGNIFHGAMRLDQLYFNRPLNLFNGYTLPIEHGGLQGLYLCGAGAHPGGGVVGAPGRLAARQALATMMSSRGY